MNVLDIFLPMLSFGIMLFTIFYLKKTRRWFIAPVIGLGIFYFWTYFLHQPTHFDRGSIIIAIMHLSAVGIVLLISVIRLIYYAFGSQKEE
ncbi:hypothetical protein [Glaesserella sp.]|uniref:hypothetical protein n=1 Tax=Glaesserella sp. TaxID=2094731 RepID=UPI0035A13C99